MSKIRSENTEGERIVFCELRKRKIYFQKHYKKILGTPDIAFPRKKIAIFIDGDFWHGRRFLKEKKRLPKKYWQEKIKSNILRDNRIRKKLKRQGWDILRVWESEIKQKPNIVMDRIFNFLANNK